MSRQSHGLSRLVALVVGFMVGCGQAEELVVPGSGSPEYVVRQLADAFNQRQSQHRVVVPSSIGTSGAVQEVAQGRATLGRVGRRLKDEESLQGLVYVPLGRDPVAVIAGAGVSVRHLTSAQMVDIYAGKIVNWRDLGGDPAPIRAVGREDSDTSRRAINQVVKGFQEVVFAPGVKVAHLDPDLIALLDRYPSSLGFLNRSAVAACTTRVSFVALDGVEPTAENLAQGRYRAWADLGLVYKAGKLTPAADAFLGFVRSDDGLRLLRQYGVTPDIR